MYALEDISKEIVQRIRDILDEKALSQTDLAARCIEAGYSVSQPEISKIMSLKVKPTLYFLLALSAVCNVSLDYLAGNGKRQAVLPIDDNSFAIDPIRDDAFKNIIGKYWAYFESTDTFYENKLLEGEMTFSASRGMCEAVFLLHTGESKDGTEVIKRYDGQLVISAKMRAMYCILYNVRIGEICFLVFRFRNFAVKEMLCRMGLVVTVSAGEQKQPVSHKLFMSRERLKGETWNEILSYLRFSQEDFTIGEEELDEIIAEYPEYASLFFGLKQTARRESRFVIRDSDFRTVNKKLSQSEIAYFKGIGLSRADTLKNVSISEKEDAAMYGLVARQDIAPFG